MTILISILGILLTIFLIVGIHELGHFMMARLAGVKVLRFSLGFGKALFRWHDKKGTEFVIAAIPLGGYVKMLDETEGEVAENELHLAFNRQPLYKKMAIVIAGPLANFILAFLLYWLLFVVGFTTLAPVIGKVAPYSIAANTGLKPHDEILSVNGELTRDWSAVFTRLMHYLGEKTEIEVKTRSLNSPRIQQHTLHLDHWKMDNLKPDPFKSLGITPYQPHIAPIIGAFLPHSPASKSPLQINDVILAINQQPIKNWRQLVTLIAVHPDKTLTFTVKRQSKIISFPVTIGYKRNGLLQKQGFLGLTPQFTWPTELLRPIQYGLLPALIPATKEVVDFTSLNFYLIGKMLTGHVSLESLGGPITVFESAGTALNNGILSFISFLAFFSIAIGVINVIPIPGLDGGHVLFYCIECIIQRPLSARVQTLFLRFGMIALLLLMTQAVINDVMRLL